MADGSRKRWRGVALGLALAVTANLAGASAVVAWRRSHLPRRTLHLKPRIVDLRFLGDGRSIAVESVEGDDGQGAHWDAFSVESETSHGRFRPPAAWGKRSTHALFAELVDGKCQLERKDVLTLERVGPDVVVDDDTVIDAALSAGEETVAVLTSGGVAIRSSETGALVKNIPVEPRPNYWRSLVVSDSQVALRNGDSTRLYALTTSQSLGHWSRTYDGDKWIKWYFLGFTSTDDLVFRVRDDQGEFDHLRVVSPDDALRFEVPAYRTAAISASGTRVAITAPVAREVGAFAVVVLALDTGAVLRSFPRTGELLAGLALSPDGDAVAIASQDGTVEIWDVPP